MANFRVPFHRYWITEAEHKAVQEVLESGWLTTGARVQALEAAFAAYQGAPFAVGVSSCTNGLRIILETLDLHPGDEVITTPLSFASTAHVIVQAGAKPVFADVDPETLMLSVETVERARTAKTKAIIVVHLAGNLAPMGELVPWACEHGLAIIEDCAHALEARDATGQAAGTLGYGGSYSFYANKNLTMGEGGLVVVYAPELEARLRRLTQHGLDYPPYEREKIGFKQYDILEAGFKFNLTEIQGALGYVQLQRVEEMWQRRAQLFQQYVNAFAQEPAFGFLLPAPGTRSAHHLAHVRLDLAQLHVSRADVMNRILARGVGLSLHFKPIHLFTYYQNVWGTRPGDCPNAEAAYEAIFTLPLYPKMTDEDHAFVVDVVQAVLNEVRR